MIRRLLLILLVSVTGVLGLSRPALAHNTLLSSDPATGTTVESAPPALTLVFDKSVPLDTLSIEIIDATGVRSDLTGSYYGPSGDVQVITPLPALSAGDVNLRWRLVGPDGHPITGRIMFTIALSVVTSTTIAIAGAPLTSSAIAVPAAVGDAVSSTTTSLAPVGAASPADSQSFSQPWTTPDSARWIMRMISYLAIVTIGGIVATLFFVWAGAWRHRLIQRAMAVSIGTAFVAAFAQLATVASDVTGLAPWASLGSMSRALETDAGVALLARMFLLGLLGWIIYSRNRSVLELRWNGAAVVVVLLLGTWAYAGHSRSMRWSVIGIPVDVAHQAAAAAWIGGLAIVGLVATNWTERDELVDIVQRFGRLAAISVSVIIGTGLIQAFRLVGSPTNLFDADHGVYLVVKILFLGVMLKVADINRQRVGRRFRDPATATPRITGILRRAMGTELAVGAVVIGITAAMVVSPPAVAQQRDTATAAAVPEAGSVELASVPALVPVQLTTPSLPDTVPTPQESSCVIEPVVLAMGSVGDSVVCLQRTLIVLGVYAGEPTGEFDSATDQAVRVLQQQLGLAVDGIVGQITASSIGIWPGL